MTITLQAVGLLNGNATIPSTIAVTAINPDVPDGNLSVRRVANRMS